MALMDDHSHCETCIHRSCQEGCAMIACDQLCGAIFHWCKKTEHEPLCSKATIPCINHDNGCPHMITRHQLGEHLAKCPASVVSCTSQWNNGPLFNKQRKAKPSDLSTIHAKFGQLSVALAMRDRRIQLKNVNQPYRYPDCYPSYNDGRSCSRFSPIQTDMHYRPPCLESDEEEDDDENANRMTKESSLTVQQMLDLNDATLPAFRMSCGQVFRRDEYASHVRNIHAEISSGLTGWLQQRCPLATYGCKFSIRGMYPNNQESRLVYSPVLECFGIQPHVPDILCHDKSHVSSIDTTTPNTREEPGSVVSHHEELDITQTKSSLLTDLPIELLECVALYLDGFSLNNLALTCQLLREVCHNILPEKGVVLQKWSRQSVDQKTHWYIADQVSSFVFVHVGSQFSREGHNP